MSKCVYRFDRYTVDPAARELRRDGELVVLSPKVFDCLTWLIEHRERAVGRDELAAAVWGKADVADTQLVQALLKARRAIGDSGEEQQRIRTVPRFGYRWIAAVEIVADDEPAADAAAVSIVLPAPHEDDVAPRPVPVAGELSRYPSLRRDIAVVVPDEVTWAQVRETVREAVGPVLNDVFLFDRYVGHNLGSGMKSLAMGLILQDRYRTLTDQDADSCVTRAVAALERGCSATLRG